MNTAIRLEKRKSKHKNATELLLKYWHDLICFCNICFGAICKLWDGQHIIHYIRTLKASRRCSSSQHYCHHSDTYTGFRRTIMAPQMMQLRFLSPEGPYTVSLKNLHCGWSSLQKVKTYHFISILIPPNCKNGQILLLKQESLFQNTQIRERSCHSRRGRVTLSMNFLFFGSQTQFLLV